MAAGSFLFFLCFPFIILDARFCRQFGLDWLLAAPWVSTRICGGCRRWPQNYLILILYVEIVCRFLYVDLICDGCSDWKIVG